MSGHIADQLDEITGGCCQKKIFILSKNSVEMVALMLGCFKRNLIACPINWRLSPKEVAVLIKGYEYAALICDSETENLMEKACDLIEEMPINRIKISDLILESKEMCTLPEAEIGECDIAIQLFTSGSTGVPKAACHTHRGMMTYAYGYAVESRWTAAEIYQTSANLFHLSGLSILISLMVGSTTVIFSRFELEEFLTVMEREKSTRVSFIPTLVTRILNDKRFGSFSFKSVKKIIYGGSPMNYTTVVQAMEKFHCQLEQAYGATESCCMAILTPEDHKKCADGSLNREILKSVGRPLPMVHARVRKEGACEDDGHTYGEIEIKTPFLCCESHCGPAIKTEEGYYPTGDIGYFDKDGFLYLVGRKHDMIICGGENIYSREVEDCIAALKDDVKQVCVLGIPDKYWGEIVTACVVRRENSEITAEELICWCKMHIASYKKPQKVFFFDTLPENANGKVSRILLKEQIQKISGMIW